MKDEEAEIEIGVIQLPHISNFTDLDPFLQEPETEVRYVTQSDSLGNPDLIIIPGTKNTIDDLIYLKKTGLDQEIIKSANKGTAIIGICGGYQMLGAKIYDPEGTESNQEELEGLDLLAINTTFSPDKLTFQAKATIEGDGEFFNGLEEIEVEGYEIHMGTSQLLTEAAPAFRIKERGEEKVNTIDGAVSDDGLVFGTYLHGIFNNDKFRRNLINVLRKKKGLEAVDREVVSAKEQLEASYEKLAEIVRDNVDMEKIYEIM
jgi:adenosylcobyric acid synthase